MGHVLTASAPAAPRRDVRAEIHPADLRHPGFSDVPTWHDAGHGIFIWGGYSLNSDYLGMVPPNEKRPFGVYESSVGMILVVSEMVLLSHVKSLFSFLGCKKRQGAVKAQWKMMANDSSIADLFSRTL